MKNKLENLDYEYFCFLRRSPSRESKKKTASKTDVIATRGIPRTPSGAVTSFFFADFCFDLRDGLRRKGRTARSQQKMRVNDETVIRH